MKKSLLVMLAAVVVAMGASAQARRTARAAKVQTPSAVKLNVTKAATNDLKVEKINANNPSRRGPGDISGLYILDYYNYYGDFVTSETFTIEPESGTTKVYDFESDEDNVDFEYNIVLKGFTWSNGVAYGYYDATQGFIEIPVQTIGTSATYGRIVLSAVTKVGDEPKNFGFDLILTVDEDGLIELYDEEEELKENNFDDGEYISGWYSYLPDYVDGGVWNFGFDIEFFAPNARMSDTEVHIENGAWGEWKSAEYNIHAEDYGNEIVVHNFFGLCPISITIDGDKASIATPVKVIDYDYADDGEDPNYIMINQWDATFDNIVNPGAITGNVYVLEDGRKLIKFYDTEYRDAWTDDNGEHEAGDYIITDYTKWFMVHGTWGENGAYWWGEARNVAILIAGDNSAGINNVSADNRGKVVATYNLMGQQVSGDTKGLVIRDGKKFVNR